MGVPAKAIEESDPKLEEAAVKTAPRVGQYQQATTKKLSISLEAEAYEWVKELAVKEGRSTSAVISDIVNETRRFRAMREWLDAAERTDGPIPEDVQAEVDAELRAAGVIK